MSKPRHISSFLSQALVGLGAQYQSTPSGRVVIDSLSEDPEILLGLIGQATEVGLVRSMGEISVLCLNGRQIRMVGR
jgi:hypothetical protein